MANDELTPEGKAHQKYINEAYGSRPMDGLTNEEGAEQSHVETYHELIERKARTKFRREYEQFESLARAIFLILTGFGVCVLLISLAIHFARFGLN